MRRNVDNTVPHVMGPSVDKPGATPARPCKRTTSNASGLLLADPDPARRQLARPSVSRSSQQMAPRLASPVWRQGEARPPCRKRETRLMDQ